MLRRTRQKVDGQFTVDDLPVTINEYIAGFAGLPEYSKMGRSAKRYNKVRNAFLSRKFSYRGDYATEMTRKFPNISFEDFEIFAPKNPDVVQMIKLRPTGDERVAVLLHGENTSSESLELNSNHVNFVMDRVTAENITCELLIAAVINKYGAENVRHLYDLLSIKDKREGYGGDFSSFTDIIYAGGSNGGRGDDEIDRIIFQMIFVLDIWTDEPTVTSPAYYASMLETIYNASVSRNRAEEVAKKLDTLSELLKEEDIVELKQGFTIAIFQVPVGQEHIEYLESCKELDLLRFKLELVLNVFGGNNKIAQLVILQYATNDNTTSDLPFIRFIRRGEDSIRNTIEALESYKNDYPNAVDLLRKRLESLI